MNILGALQRLLGGAGKAVGGAVQGAEHAVAQAPQQVAHAAQNVAGSANIAAGAGLQRLGIGHGGMVVDPKYLGYPADNSGQQMQPLAPTIQQTMAASQQPKQAGQGVWGPYGIQDANQAIKNGQPFIPQANVYGQMIDQGMTPHVDPQFYGYPADNGQYK